MQALAISTKVDQVCPGKLDKNLNKQGLKNNVVIAINHKLWKSRGTQSCIFPEMTPVPRQSSANEG
ncbi:hypothetical protein F444_22626 [Phytophthora nicotianae P1976]|uniref:Uncharacterized protein n=1 Tax=Phytophthora nicotianae P1976 TaxID=1317066 RepID=A0A080YX85_PHYNI|nr:hypothetical protein F444_22626 [Phytophthora nicotianae P1976]